VLEIPSHQLIRPRGLGAFQKDVIIWGRAHLYLFRRPHPKRPVHEWRASALEMTSSLLWKRGRLMSSSSCERKRIMGQPDADHISTSYVERQNLTMRMSMRRFTRLTNGFSKKIENHAYAVAIHYMHYNFCRIHRTLRVTPAMEAGLTNHVWSVADIFHLILQNASVAA
jgi:hypothetical protein